ncbi:MAG TPA: hypothetical protein VMZ29_05770 [Candidatus Bathyarchaeia archaeon]|nr:hypothetical protein [Candidatus Bathyarchaeia archaeon]
MENIEKKLDNIYGLLKIISRKEIKDLILELITNNDELLLYHESDGEKTCDQLNEITGISTGKISLCWDKWEKNRILEKIAQSRGGRGKKLFNLEELGIEIPKK